MAGAAMAAGFTPLLFDLLLGSQVAAAREPWVPYAGIPHVGVARRRSCRGGSSVTAAHEERQRTDIIARMAFLAAAAFAAWRSGRGWPRLLGPLGFYRIADLRPGGPRIGRGQGRAPRL